MPLALEFKILTFDHLTSTQDTMRSKLEAGEPIHGLVIRALEQSGARGQRARDWQSTRGGSYQTLAVKDNGTLNKPFAALLLAIGLAETLPDYGLQVTIKWPNDLYYKGKKVAGLLCEYTNKHLLIGLGINVNNDIPDTATAFRGLDVEGVSNMAIAGLQHGLELLNNPPNLPEAFKPYDLLNNHPIRIHVKGKEQQGIARGIDQNGCLKLELPTGTLPICHQNYVLGTLKPIENTQ